LKLLFLTDNFPPEVNAPATRTFEHCKEWVKQGVEVSVITCAPNFPKGKVFKGYKNKLIQKETMESIKVIRVWSYMAENKGVFKRALDYFSFAFSSFFAGLFIKSDIIIATSPQFFTAISGRMLGFWKRTPWIMEVRDLWPESIKNVNAINDNALMKVLEREEKKCYRKALAIIPVTDTFKSIIIEKDIDPSKIEVIKNGSNLDLLQPRSKPEKLLKELKLENKFVIGYLGTHGMAHKLEFILQTAKKINNPTVHFLFIGDGAEKQYLLELSKQLELTNVTFKDTVMKQEIASHIALLDIALIPLKKSELFKSVIPSKIFESAAMEKPILLGVDGEARELVESYGAGLYFEPENEADLIEKINLFLNKKVDLEKMKLGCRQLALDYDRKRLAQKMLEFIQIQVAAAKKK
jgi:glycosyltransferase involved in cell wall biosynthesis